MNEQQWQYLWQQLSKFADAISIIGAGASVYAAWQIGTIVKRFRFRAEVPKLTASIDKDKDKLPKLFGKFTESQNEIILILAQCEANLNTLSKQLSSVREFDKHDMKALKNLIQTIQEVKRSPSLDEHKVREIWADMNATNQIVKNLINLLQWE